MCVRMSRLSVANHVSRRSTKLVDDSVQVFYKGLKISILLIDLTSQLQLLALLLRTLRLKTNHQI